MQYQGRVVSLLIAASDDAASAGFVDAAPHLIGRPTDGLSVVSVNGARHAVLLVSDLGSAELTELSRNLALPLAERVGSLVPDCPATNASLISANTNGGTD